MIFGGVQNCIQEEMMKKKQEKDEKVEEKELIKFIN